MGSNMVEAIVRGTKQKGSLLLFVHSSVSDGWVICEGHVIEIKPFQMALLVGNRSKKLLGVQYL